MQKFKKKREFKKKLYSKLVLIFLLIILLLIIHGTWGIWKKSRQSHNALEISKEEYQELKDREGQIKGKIERLKTETGLEEEIRSKFNVAREGEQIIVIVDDEEGVTDTEEKPGGIRGIFTTVKSWFQ